MARIVDPEKLENIKKALMEALVEHGYGGMSIATISEKAGVSPGYLYRYYNSKEELVQELVELGLQEFKTNVQSHINTSSTVYEAAYKSIHELLMKANHNPIFAKFTATVVLDLRIPTKDKLENFKSIMNLAEAFIRLGIKTGEISPDVTAQEFFIVYLTIPFRYIAFSLELDSNKIFTQEEANRVTEICLKALK